MIEFVVWFLSNFLAAIGIISFYISLFEEKAKINKKIVILFVLNIVVCTFIRFFELSLLNIFSFFIFYPVIFYLLSPKKFKFILYYTIFIWIYGAVFDFLTMLIISYLYLAIDINMRNYLFKIVPTIVSLFFFILSSRISFIKKFTNNIVNLLANINNTDLFVITFFAFVFISGVAITLNIDSLSISILVFVLIFIVILVFLLLVHCKYLEYESKIFTKTLQVNNNFYTNIDDEYSIFKHNLIAKLLSVKSVSNKNARLLIDDLVNDFNSNMDYRNIILDLPYGLDGVINHKLCNYSNILNIKISNNFTKDIFDVLTPKRYNVLVEKLSLMLDNAIESALDSVEKILIVNLMEDNDSIKIEIKNTFDGKKVDVDEIGKIHYSTKGKKRGLGLYFILRNNEVLVNVKFVNSYFVGEAIAKFNQKIKSSSY